MRRVASFSQVPGGEIGSPQEATQAPQQGRDDTLHGSVNKKS
jgi:hypothetical protein